MESDCLFGVVSRSLIKKHNHVGLWDGFRLPIPSFLTADFRSSFSDCRSFVLRDMPITLPLENDPRKLETSWIFILCFHHKIVFLASPYFNQFFSLCTSCLFDFSATNHVDTSTKHESLILFIAEQTQLTPFWQH